MDFGVHRVFLVGFSGSLQRRAWLLRPKQVSAGTGVCEHRISMVFLTRNIQTGNIMKTTAVLMVTTTMKKMSPSSESPSVRKSRKSGGLRTKVILSLSMRLLSARPKRKSPPGFSPGQLSKRGLWTVENRSQIFRQRGKNLAGHLGFRLQVLSLLSNQGPG